MELETLVVEVPPVTLANLPEDVIREIIRVAGPEEEESLRLISRSWNAMVVESKKRHLDTVRIERGGAQWNTKDVKVTMNFMKLDDMERFQDVFREWTIDLRANQVKSPPLHVKTNYIADQWAYFALIYSLASLVLALRIHFYLAGFLLIGYVVFLGYLNFWVSPGVGKNCQRLSKLFARTSSIRELYLVNLDRTALKVIKETLGEVPVNHLIVVDKDCDKQLTKAVLELARAHKVGKVTLCIKRCDERVLWKFFLDSAPLPLEIHVYEKSLNTDEIFGKRREFWATAARDFKSSGSVLVDVMNGEQLQGLEIGHQYRFRVTF